MLLMDACIGIVKMHSIYLVVYFCYIFVCKSRFSDLLMVKFCRHNFIYEYTLNFFYLGPFNCQKTMEKTCNF